MSQPDSTITMPVRRLRPNETPSQLAKAGYDKHAQTYLDWTTSKPSNSRLHYLQQVLDLLSSHSHDASGFSSSSSQAASKPPAGPGGGAVLELGCGAGVPVTLCLARADAVRHVVATDISRTQLELLREKLRELDHDHGCGSVQEKVEVVESDMLDLSFEPGRFGAVVAFFSLIHLAREDQRTMMWRVWGWLDEGGCFCANFGVLDENEDGDEGEVQVGGGKDGSTTETGSVVEGWLGMNAYWDGYGMERTMTILKEVGFEIVVADVVEEVGDANFLFVIARKLSASRLNVKDLPEEYDNIEV